MTSIYTKKGDDGDTGLLGEGRFSKASLRIDVLGNLDEASAALAVARSAIDDTKINLVLSRIQKDLYNMMAEVGTTPENAHTFRRIDKACVDWLEQQIEQNLEITGAPTEFIIPGEVSSSAYLSLARTIVRRAERRLVELHTHEPFENPHLITYINRLSSLCFSLELLENHRKGVSTRAIKDL